MCAVLKIRGEVNTARVTNIVKVELVVGGQVEEG